MVNKIRLKSGNLYRVNFKEEFFYNKNHGMTAEQVNFFSGDKGSVVLKQGDLLLFLEKGKPQKRTLTKYSCTPYRFLRNKEIIVFEKTYDRILSRIFEEIEEKEKE